MPMAGDRQAPGRLPWWRRLWGGYTASHSYPGHKPGLALDKLNNT